MFLSARPGRGATCRTDSSALSRYRFYPHAPGGARPNGRHIDGKFEGVSIRTPRAGRDVYSAAEKAIIRGVSIRTPRAGRDPTRVLKVTLPQLFLSARPGRGATQL